MMQNLLIICTFILLPSLGPRFPRAQSHPEEAWGSRPGSQVQASSQAEPQATGRTRDGTLEDMESNKRAVREMKTSLKETAQENPSETLWARRG